MASVEVSEDNSGFVDNWQSGKTLAECNLHMLTSEDSCDVSFRVGKEGTPVRAHRYVLTSRSCVFYAMLCGPLAEKEDIKIPDVEEELFSEMLRYLYTDTTTVTAENVTGLLYLAKKYSVGGLERLCVAYLESSLTAENACVILEQAHVFDEEKLFDRALELVVKHCGTTVKSSGFTSLCASCFHKVVSADYFLTNDETSFNAVLSWAESECKRQGREITPENKRLVLGEAVYNISFTSMDTEMFAKTVVPSGILSSDESNKLLCYLISNNTDVAPFKMKPELHMGVNLYASQIQSRTSQQDSSNSSGTSREDSSIIISCSQDMRLTGVWAYGDDSCIYNISLDQEESHTSQSHNLRSYTTVKTWVQREVSAVLERSIPNKVHLKLSEVLILEKLRRYRIAVTRESNKSGFLGSSVFNNITLGECQISVKEGSGPGLISSLIIEHK
ncbi:BTB/POZ domain-containing protein 6-like [Haliotis rubra]|uniref:BTB/POZ domain-containing protein 6-like n=1 Tax=Haliotis rubra TaxID=36100 RepID=UPI001EE54DD7|nr:BTB/POZ domain-containing protein 6-like [Haliotis rubra]